MLITLEYTALHHYDYQQQVIKQLESTFSADRTFSFRIHFSDQWYDLHNPELLEEPGQMVVSFRIEREDFPPNLEGFPPNLENLTIDQVVLYFVTQNGSVPIENVNMQYVPDGGIKKVLEDARPVNGKISTREGMWTKLTGQLLPGEWIMSLRPADHDPQKVQKLAKLKEWFKSEKKGEKCEDSLFVITYSGRTQEWPA